MQEGIGGIGGVEEERGVCCAHSHLYLHLLSSGLSAAQRSKETALDGRESNREREREIYEERERERQLACE